MIRLFFKQHMSWLFFLVAVQCLFNFILMIDSGVQSISLMYVNLIWFLVVFFFLVWRFTVDREKLASYNLEGSNYIDAVKESYELKLETSEVEMQQRTVTLLNYQDELLAWVHEMKAPMTSMQLLMDQIEGIETRERMEAQWLRLYLLVDQQLHATRLLTIEQDNRMEKFELKAVLIEEVKALRSWCFDKKIAIDLTDVERTIISDRKWLAFIIRQILSNAVKYSHVGGEIKIYSTIQNGQVELMIQDQGIGIKKEDLPRVFRKSYTGTIGRETSAATGMGLYLAKQSSASLNINLEIESVEKEGTKVKILFPSENLYNQTLL